MKRTTRLLMQKNTPFACHITEGLRAAEKNGDNHR
jgi:TPR repeat protein